ncbi:hypothetical protein MRX96_057282 [Rhipicephalus microplus]
MPVIRAGRDTPSYREELCQLEEVVPDQNFHDNGKVHAHNDAEEVLDDEEIWRFVPGAEDESEEPNDSGTVDASMPPTKSGDGCR